MIFRDAWLYELSAANKYRVAREVTLMKAGVFNSGGEISYRRLDYIMPD